MTRSFFCCLLALQFHAGNICHETHFFLPQLLGLSPSWYLQHVIVRDLQSSKSYFFLVNDWLSVESEENDGMVEKEVYAASECSAPGHGAGVTGQCGSSHC